MKRLVAMVVAAGAALAAEAMPTKAELQKAQAMVSDVTASDVSALRKKEKTPADVAARHMELAGQAGNEAEKYLLLQAAFKLYAKAGDYEGAANALGTMNREISDMAPEVIVEIYNNAIFSSMKEKAPKLFAIKESARRQVFYRKQLAKAEVAVKANPKDLAAQKKLGECHAELGDWPKALDAFALAGGNLAKTAVAEKDGSASPQVSGDFWWDYENGDEMSTYKLHAAELYRTALTDESFKGLARTRTEQRIKEADKVAADLAWSGTYSAPSSPLPLGSSRPAPMTFGLAKDVKLEMMGCPAGEFDLQARGRCKIQRPFWLGKVAVTVAQWTKVVDGQDMVEEDVKRDFPKGSTSVAERNAFMEKLNQKFAAKCPRGYVFRLPTEAELMYAMTCGGQIKEQAFAAFGPSEEDKRRYVAELCAKPSVSEADKKWLKKVTRTKVGLSKPNDWGFQDVVGNGEHIVSDRSTDDGNAWNQTFRVCLGPDLVVEKPATSNGRAENSSRPSPSDSSVPSSTSRLAPMTFDLAKGVKLEMLGCPAGMFKMSNAPGGPNGDGTHEVKLTRTYWIASSCVTRAMYKAFEADYDKDEKTEGEKKPGDLVTGCARAEAFARWLNKRFQSKLPRGYVFRLPSEAEWEYAMNMGIVARHWDFEGTLDTVRAVSGKANAWKFDVSVMDYAATESDPVRVYSQNPAWVCRQDAKKRCLLRLDGQGCFRMVVGPDLIAEKKAKK